MIRADYFVITMERNASVDAHFPSIIGQYVSGGKEARIMNYYGQKGNNGVFVGESSDRVMVWCSGKEADYVARTIQVEKFGNYSVARIDLQITMAVLDADYMIEYIQPSKVYKSMKITNINEKGTTLYIGAPTSDLRLRIYNKTAESDIRPDSGGEYVRIELQCRNRYADKAFIALRNNMVRAFYLMLLKRMIDGYNYKLIESALRESDEELFIDTFPVSTDDPLARRKRWLENSVFPAMRRMLLEDKDYLDKFIERLYNGDNESLYSDTY
jgi:hypothetical protein